MTGFLQHRDELKLEAAALKEENAILKGNSSINPASDLKPIPKTNLREKSGKKPAINKDASPRTFQK